jgi:hypothetical protein
MRSLFANLEHMLLQALPLVVKPLHGELGSEQHQHMLLAAQLANR